MSFLINGAQAQQMVRLAWNPSSNQSVMGYRIYYGVGSRNYNKVVDAGNTTGVAIPNLTPGVTYYFASTAYNVVGLESVFSSEISYTPSTLAQLQLITGSSTTVKGAGLPGHTFEIQATSNFLSWTVLGTVTAGSNGSFQFIDPNASNFTRRFYRTRDTLP